MSDEELSSSPNPPDSMIATPGSSCNYEEARVNNSPPTIYIQSSPCLPPRTPDLQARMPLYPNIAPEQPSKPPRYDNQSHTFQEELGLLFRQAQDKIMAIHAKNTAESCIVNETQMRNGRSPTSQTSDFTVLSSSPLLPKDEHIPIGRSSIDSWCDPTSHETPFRDMEEQAKPSNEACGLRSPLESASYEVQGVPLININAREGENIQAPMDTQEIITLNACPAKAGHACTERHDLHSFGCSDETVRVVFSGNYATGNNHVHHIDFKVCSKVMERSCKNWLALQARCRYAPGQPITISIDSDPTTVDIAALALFSCIHYVSLSPSPEGLDVLVCVVELSKQLGCPEIDEVAWWLLQYLAKDEMTFEDALFTLFIAERTGHTEAFTKAVRHLAFSFSCVSLARLLNTNASSPSFVKAALIPALYTINANMRSQIISVLYRLRGPEEQFLRVLSGCRTTFVKATFRYQAMVEIASLRQVDEWIQAFRDLHKSHDCPAEAAGGCYYSSEDYAQLLEALHEEVSHFEAATCLT